MEENSTSAPSQYIRHFTDVCALFQILENGFRLNPPKASWDDKNDFFTLTQYAKLTNRDVYILCFCEGIGNIHHWTYFGAKKVLKNGLCFQGIKCNIKLNRKKFEEVLDKRDPCLKLKVINYNTANEINRNLTSIEELPYLKRSEYQVEKERRVVASVCKDGTPPSNVVIPLNCIEGINILLDENSKNLFDVIRRKIEKAYPELKGKIDYNGAMESKQWQKTVRNRILELKSDSLNYEN